MGNSNRRLCFEEYMLDADRHVLERDGHEVPLRPKTLGVLRYLIDHRHRVVSKDELLAAVWPGVMIETQGVFQSISELRAAFGRRGFIRTVRGTGYQWIAPTSELSGDRSIPSRARRIAGWRLAGSVTALLGAFLILSVLNAVPVQTTRDTTSLTADALLERARDHLSSGELDSAEKHLSIVLDQNPDHLEARLDLAYIHMQRGLDDAARLLATEVHSDSIANGTEYVRMASAALISQLPIADAGRPIAETYAREAVSIATRLQLPVFAAAGYERLGELYLDQGKPTLAALEWNKALDHYQSSCPTGEDRVRRMLASLPLDS